MVCSSVEWGVEWVEGFSELYLLLPLMLALVVILNHLGVIHSWRSQKMTNFMTPHVLCHPLHLQKWTIDLLLKIKSICRHLTDFETPPHEAIPLLCGRHKCMVPYMFAVIWIFWFRKNYHPVVWTKQASHQNIN